MAPDDVPLSTRESTTALPRHQPAARTRPRRRSGWFSRRSGLEQREITDARLTREIERRDARYRRLLALADISAAGFSLLIAAWVTGDALSPLALLALPFAVLIGKLAKLYDRDELLVRKSTLDEVPALARLSIFYAFTVYLSGDAIVAGPINRPHVVIIAVAFFLSMTVTRAGARKLARSMTPAERCLIAGPSGVDQWIRQRFAHASGIKVEIVGRVSPATLQPGSSGLAAAERAIAEYRVDRVILAADGISADETLEAIHVVKNLGVKLSVVPHLFGVMGSSTELDEVDGTTLLGMRRYGLTRSSRLVKRSMDVIGAGLGVALLAPLMLCIAIAVRLDSPGPLLFRQRRMGLGGVPFEMLKFRTMVDGAEARKEELQDDNEAGGGLFKIRRDPRITTVGRFMRRTSLDELPQLFNVLRGEMSLVGPRPLVIDEDNQITGWARRRLHLPPGMTGMWQIFGSARIPLEEMVKIDYLYGANWSLWLDVKILLRTITVVFGARGL